jgi:adenine-specific DNA-methyltransferase
MNKLKLHTPDLTAANVERIAALFPNCITEATDEAGKLKRAIDFDLLKQELSADLVEGPQERYRLDWPGKREALALANTPVALTLRPCRGESVDFENTKNLYIEGDNLDALKLLQETYLGRVKMIYIDPPYNTGNDFIYDDDFSMSKDQYKGISGDRDEEGNAMFDAEKWRQNSSANGRFHSEWLSMMYPRLKLARNLLREDGLVFISIDDNEAVNLMKVCDEVFGADNFITNFSVENNPKGRKNSKFVSVSNEYCVAYARDATSPEAGFIESISKGDSFKLDEQGRKYTHGKRVLVGVSTNPPVKMESDKNYVVYFDESKCDLIIKVENISDEDSALISQGYKRFHSRRNDVLLENTYTKQKLLELHNDGALLFKMDSIYEKDFNINKRVKSILVSDGKYDIKTETAGVFLCELSPYFDFPKNIGLIKLLLGLCGGDDYLVLDFFSGSATSAHAVMQLNAEDGGKRRHIMVQLPEPCDAKSEAFKAGYKTIAEIGKERIRRAGKKILAEWQAKQAKEKSEQGDLLTPSSDIPVPHSPPDIGFRVLKIDSSNFADIHRTPDALDQKELALHTEHIKPERTPEDLLFQVLVDWGVDLALSITEEIIDGKQVFFVDGSNDPTSCPALAACFDTGLTDELIKAIAARQPMCAVFRDESYGDDSTRINVGQLFKLLSPNTELKSL